MTFESYAKPESSLTTSKEAHDKLQYKQEFEFHACELVQISRTHKSEARDLQPINQTKAPKPLRVHGKGLQLFLGSSPSLASPLGTLIWV